MFEPRGHDGMYGALLIPEPDHADAHIGVLFMHNGTGLDAYPCTVVGNGWAY